MVKWKKEGPLDKSIKRTTNFKQVIDSIVAKMFNVETDVKRIYVDLNSCVSVLFRYNDVNNPEVSTMVSNYMEKFLLKYLETKTEIMILFTLEKSQAHIDVYPDWCKERYERVDISKSGFLRTLLLSLNEFSKKNPLVKVINTYKVHPALIIYKTELNRRTKFCVLSKDYVFQCMIMKNMSIWTGVNYIDMEDNPRQLPEDIEIKDPDTMLPYYLAIRGDMRNEYDGIEGYGKKKTSKYIDTERIKIKADAEHPFKEVCDKYSQLYRIDKLLELNKQEIKIIK